MRITSDAGALSRPLKRPDRAGVGPAIVASYVPQRAGQVGKIGGKIVSRLRVVAVGALLVKERLRTTLNRS